MNRGIFFDRWNKFVLFVSAWSLLEYLFHEALCFCILRFFKTIKFSLCLIPTIWLSLLVEISYRLPFQV